MGNSHQASALPITPIKRQCYPSPPSSVSVTHHPHRALAPPFIPAPAHLSQRTYFSREGLQMQRSAKIPTMGCTRSTAHCRDSFLLAAADAPLSREIICCQKGSDLAYRKSEHPRIVLKRTASGAQLFGIGRR